MQRHAMHCDRLGDMLRTALTLYSVWSYDLAGESAERLACTSSSSVTEIKLSGLSASPGDKYFKETSLAIFSHILYISSAYPMSVEIF